MRAEAWWGRRVASDASRGQQDQTSGKASSRRPNLFDNRLYVWQSLDVVKLWRAFVSDDPIEFLMCSGLYIGEVYEGKNERLNKRGRGVGPAFDQVAPDVARDVEDASSVLV